MDQYGTCSHQMFVQVCAGVCVCVWLRGIPFSLLAFPEGFRSEYVSIQFILQKRDPTKNFDFATAWLEACWMGSGSSLLGHTKHVLIWVARQGQPTRMGSKQPLGSHKCLYEGGWVGSCQWNLAHLEQYLFLSSVWPVYSRNFVHMRIYVTHTPTNALLGNRF